MFLLSIHSCVGYIIGSLESFQVLHLCVEQLLKIFYRQIIQSYVFSSVLHLLLSYFDLCILEFVSKKFEFTFKNIIL